jgi:hypothetical protein
MPVRRVLVASAAALAGLVVGTVVSGGGAPLLAVVLGLTAWWLSGRYFAKPS